MLEQLSPFVGEWDIEVSLPSPSDVTARAVFEWALDGRFLLQRTEISIPEAPNSFMKETFPGIGASRSFTASTVSPKIPSCFPTNRPTAVPSATGAARLEMPAPWIETPELASANRGMMTNATMPWSPSSIRISGGCARSHSVSIRCSAE